MVTGRVKGRENRPRALRARVLISGISDVSICLSGSAASAARSFSWFLLSFFFKESPFRWSRLPRRNDADHFIAALLFNSVRHNHDRRISPTDGLPALLALGVVVLKRD